MTDRVDTEAIAARLNAATPGPWMVWPKGDERESVVCERAQHTIVARCPGADGDKRWEWGTVHHPEADAELIAAAPGDIAALLAEVARLTAERDDYRATGMRWRDRLVIAEEQVGRLREELEKIATMKPRNSRFNKTMAQDGANAFYAVQAAARAVLQAVEETP